MTLSRTSEHEVGEYAGYRITLGGSGLFCTVLDGQNESASSLQALKVKIDKKLREKAREDAKATPAVVLEIGPRYRYSNSDEPTPITWREGHFVGVDATTGDIRFLIKGDKRPVLLSGSGYYVFRPKDPALKAFKNLLAAFLLAEREMIDAQRRMEKMREQVGFVPQFPSYISRGKERTREAAKLEISLVAFLQGKTAEKESND